LIKQRKNLNLPWLKAVFDSRTAGVFLATRNAHFYGFFKRSFAKHFYKGMCRRQCCGSGMFIPDPDFYPFRIPNPKTATKERGEKNLFVKPLFVATNFTKLKII
jgi:hypothetical protein